MTTALKERRLKAVGKPTIIELCQAFLSRATTSIVVVGLVIIDGGFQLL
jgi:hypothetical protein